MGRISEEEAESHYSGGNFNGEWFVLKNHGDIARVQFLHDSMDDLPIYSTHKVQVGDKERYVDCLRSYDEPIDNCPFCAAGFPVKPVRFVLMYDHADGKTKIWERGKNFITKLQSLMNRYNPLSNYVFEIERNGKAGDKETKYEVFPMDQVQPEDLSELEPVEIFGGLILDKTVDEMEVYLETGNFPATDGDQQQAPPAQVTPRRASVNPTQQPSRAANTAPAGSRRGPVNPQPAQTSRFQANTPNQSAAPRSSRRGNGTEKF